MAIQTRVAPSVFTLDRAIDRLGATRSGPDVLTARSALGIVRARGGRRVAKTLVVALMGCTLACATGRELGPNPAFSEAPKSCPSLAAAWEQHWIETFDQLTTGALLDPAPERRSNWALRVVRLPFAVSTDVITLAGFGAAGALVQVPVHTVEDVRPPACPGAPSRSGAVTMGRAESD